MKTLLDVKSDIAALTESLPTLKKKKQESAKKKILFLNQILLYLESMPDDGFVKNEIIRLENRINAILNQFDPTLYKDPKPAKMKYEKDMKIPRLREQVRTLRYILN